MTAGPPVPRADEADLDEAIAVRAVGEGRLEARVDGRWSAPTGPNGGYLAAIVARAAEVAVPDPQLRLRTVACHYLRPPADGPVELEVTTLRAGRRVTTLRVALRQDGRDHVDGTATLVRADLPEAGAWRPLAPDVAPAPALDAREDDVAAYRPDGGTWLAPPDGSPPIVTRVRIAPRVGPPPFTGGGLEPGRRARAGGWMAPRGARPVDAALLVLAADTWWPPAFGPLDRPAIAPTLDLVVHVRGDVPREGLAPSAVLGDFTSTAAAGGLVEEDGTLWHPDGTLLAQSRQLALLAPVDA